MLFLIFFTMKSLRRWLARQVCLSGIDPSLLSATPSAEDVKGWDSTLVAALLAAASCQLEVPSSTCPWIHRLRETSCSWTTRTISPPTFSFHRRTTRIIYSPHWPGLHSQRPPLLRRLMTGVAHQRLPPPRWTCSRCANARLPDWTSSDLTTVAEVARSCYEGKTFPLARNAASPHLPTAAGRDGVFMEIPALQRQEPDPRSLVP